MQTSPARRRLWAADIHRIVAKEFGISVEAITGTCRGNRYVNARFVFMVLTREFLPHITLMRIATQFLKRDHSCVYNMLDRAEVFMARPGVSEILATCRDKVEFLCAQEAQSAPLTAIFDRSATQPSKKPKPRPAASYEVPSAALYEPQDCFGRWRVEKPLGLQCRQNEDRMRRALLAAHPELCAYVTEEN